MATDQWVNIQDAKTHLSALLAGDRVPASMGAPSTSVKS
jgi:hypothetical protein